MDKQDGNIHVARFGQVPGQRESVAAVLSRARERHGQDIRSVSQVLRIRQAYLEALESGESNKLPGTAYALGFLRTYAEYLGLNANNIIDRYKEEVQSTDRPTELIFPEPVIEGRIPGGAIILISVALLMVAYGGWFYLSHQGQTIAGLVPALPAQLQALIGGDETESVSPEPQAPVETAKVTEAQAEPAVGTSTEASTAAPDPAPEPAPVKIEVQRQVEAPAAEASSPPVAETAVAAAVPEKTEPAPRIDVQEPASGETIQATAQPQADTATDTTTEVYSGPPITPGPAPDLVALNRKSPRLTAPVVAETPARPQQIEPQDSTASIIGQTVVIPAPPSAPKVFSLAGERTPRVYGEGNEGVRIVLHALQDSWVQVRDNRDALLLTRVLRSGDVYHVPDQIGLTLLTGNAGGIQLEVDGVRLAPLGPIGAVRRQIALDPSILLNGATQ